MEHIFTSGTSREMVLAATRKLKDREWYESPVARNRMVTAILRPGSSGGLPSELLVMWGDTLCTSSWNRSGSMRMKDLKSPADSRMSSCIRVS